MKKRLLFTIIFAGATALIPEGFQAGASAQDAKPGVVILDTAGSWRVFETLAPPVILSKDGPKPLLFGKTWLEQDTPPPPDTWTRPDFDDGGWLRGPARAATDSPKHSHSSDGISQDLT